MTPDLQKSSKIWNYYEKIFLLTSIKKVLIPVLNNILGSFGEF